MLAVPLSLNAQTHQDGVIIHEVGDSYLFIFPSSKGRIFASMNRAGRIDFGKTITVMYSLKITGGRARFILFDTTKAHGIAPKLSVQEAKELFGFLVKDSNQAKLEMYIDPSFMQKVPVNSKNRLDSLRNEIVRQGNLDVVISREGQVYKIVNVRLN